MAYRGFYWSANSPYIQSMWVRVRRAPRAAALSSNVNDGTITRNTGALDANPAYLIYECLTNTDWGMGGAPSAIDTASFLYAAQVFKNENLGMFVFWDTQQAIEDFVGDVLDHVQAYLFLDPRSGLLTLKPLRADYTIADLPLFNPDNCEVSDFDRKQWGETVNEIVVTWTNPLTEQTETVTMQDLANIVQQGGQIVSDSRNYYGFRQQDVAFAAAARDLRAACAPLSTCSLKANRIAWDLVPGDCLRLTRPEEDVEELVMRVQTIDYGVASDGYVTVTLIEDIFALDAQVYTGDQGSDWANPAELPNPLAHPRLLTVPAFLAANYIFPVQPVEPEVCTLIFGADPNDDFATFEPYTTVTLANGSTDVESSGTQPATAYAEVPTGGWPAQVSTPVTTFDNVLVRPPQLADLLFIGSGDETTGTEIAIVQAVNADGSYVLYRGILDTVPRAWPAGTPMWVLSTDSIPLDTELRSPGETVSYRLLMRTSLGLLDYAAAPDTTFTLSERPYLPLRPANVKVNGTGFGTVALAGGAAAVSWSNRNRLLETSSVLGWDASTVAPENNQSTTVEVLSSTGAVLHSHTGLTGTSFSVPASEMSGASAIRVSSARDGLTSLQSFIVSVTP